ncbi:Potassium-transporting ATPase A chain [Thermoanaerobacterium xylanolyticum LX-11]|uniref:Potassium-transporting ATPase potassium-binding subunit n=1 Tax=Thermoanaerobacterium xylanolyticum (strain ATCC 49914 / DSM 7097 / LX-11) TaxID=858215 RepID=F6BJD5_THEXL|nr:potassium-transporting ATPase subunit KdpA [Thermoanaerobacterium xylanolyticum]AEF16903.1 Potassium-transporting ATPase A chain [Thermoanaerobacterium xylanolyticum LX-11]
MIYDILQMVIFICLLVIITIPLGSYIAKVFTNQHTFFDFVAKPIEKFVYKITGIDESHEMNWKEYALSLLTFNLLGIIFLFIILVSQGKLPLNPQKLPGVSSWHLALNTAVSFVTNTNWQAYSGETTVSYLTQMLGFTVQNFLSAATGLSVAIALIRGIMRHSTKDIGNFWVDITKSIIWIFLPLSLILSLILTQQGVIQNFSSYIKVHTLEGLKQVIAMGPVASQEAIKMLGTNGGGFFGANSAHPFENPTPLTNMLEMLAILAIPASLPYTFGKMVKNTRQGWAIFSAMLILFVIMLGTTYYSEKTGNPIINHINITGPSAMEGKEVRFGIAGSSLFSTVTTAASCGAVNSSLDSMTPLGGLIPMLQIMLGEVIFGGVGSGLYSMLIDAFLAVFIVGLMVGRTPEYIGKKIESYEMKMSILAIIIPASTILIGSAIASVTKAGTSVLLNHGPHGLSEILYAFASTAGNNGSAFAGLNSNTLFYNLITSIAMIIGRFGVIIPALAIAGSLANKKIVPASVGTFPTDNALFSVLLVGIVLIIGALTFFPALSLGPIIEQLLMNAGRLF